MHGYTKTVYTCMLQVFNDTARAVSLESRYFTDALIALTIRKAD